MLETSMDMQQLHRAATAYYLDDMRQAEVASLLGVSRPSVSKLLAEARRIGMVRFEVLDVPSVDLGELAAQVRELLGLEAVRIAPGDQVQRGYRGLGELLGEELAGLGLRRGEVLLISSGTTTHAVSQVPGLPDLPGVVVAPTVGGQQEFDPSFQTNETARAFADRTGALPRFIFAPALPSPSLWESLQADPSFLAITELWDRARVLVTGVGAPFEEREAITSVLPREDPDLRRAIGDVCLHFFDAEGRMITHPGAERLVRPSVEQLRAIPTSIALAVGRAKAGSIRAGARTGMFTSLITDVPTAEALLADS
ncbi:transcriptional regulator [Brachybacterium saurashtrense]|uniref:Transcriptional regulator n=2 Tax=Brachybacterium saurashtrense TaxID=556288 RepID=A0AA93AWJ2_9MICO|nr:sugar-binding domain-containing protein [Brachybacterium saurashtrense]RRR24116.1 transcriptional regulator [Brachybacterium saurashtrense]